MVPGSLRESRFSELGCKVGAFMRGLLQRVTSAQVEVSGEIIGTIGPGLVLFVGFDKGDDETKLEPFLNKVINYRIFDDADHLMNKSLLDVSGGLLVVSQFTLVANTRKGLRPSFSEALSFSEARVLYKSLIEVAKETLDVELQYGQFGSDMEVTLTNSGPTTFIL